MADNPLTQIRRAFQIPESVTIIAGQKLNILSKPLGTNSEKFAIDNTLIEDEPIYTSKLGTPVMSDLEILGGSYETGYNSRVITFDGIIFDAVLMTVYQPKKIIMTEIQGRDGTVKEYIGMGDYEVTINGVITGTNGIRPVEEINTLKQILDAPIALDVVSSYLQALGIDKIVVKDYTFEQAEGSYSYQSFSINAVSDVPQELRITNV